MVGALDPPCKALLTAASNRLFAAKQQSARQRGLYMSWLTISLTCIPHHHATEGRELGFCLLNDCGQCPDRHITATRRRRRSRNTYIHLDVGIGRHGFRPVVPVQ